MKQNKNNSCGTRPARFERKKAKLLAVLCSIVYGLLAKVGFTSGLHWQGLEPWSIDTFSFLLLVPFAMGLITAHFTFFDKTNRKLSIVARPLLAVLGLFLLSALLQSDIIIYALVLLPAYLLLAVLGSATGAYLRSAQKSKTLIYIGVLMPFLIAPLENYWRPNEKIYRQHSSMIIHADAEAIWENMIRVAPITTKDIKEPGIRLPGFPQPVRAAFDTIAVGGQRKAIFDRGLRFTEKITAVVPQQHLAFNIQADPASRAKTALEQRIIIHGDFFSVISGAFDLEPARAHKTRLHFTTQYRLSTHCNFYYSFWTKIALSQIQKNILQVIKSRSEQKQQNH